MNEVVVPEVVDKPFIGICHFCLALKTFRTEQERALWERHHPHDEGLS